MTLPAPRPAAVLLLVALQAAAGRVLYETAGQPASTPLPADAIDVSADIFRGSEAPPGVFDWMVNMKAFFQDPSTGGVSEKHMCGGALIGPDAVLTAAHCVVMEDGSTIPLEAVALEVGGQQYRPSALHVHPDYDHAALTAQNADFSDGIVDNPPQPMHDLAVWRLSSAVPDASQVQLPAADLELLPGTLVEVAGWGRTGSDASLPSSDTLLYAQLQLAAPFDWNNQGAAGTCPMPSFTDTLCAVNTVTGANACAGDSGGPLIVRDYVSGAATVVGIVSHGPPCDLIHYGIYTDVRRYLDSITEWMA
ncbi:hypothetical protein ABPG75_010336 [Micractinium tetrahymenae]